LREFQGAARFDAEDPLLPAKARAFVALEPPPAAEVDATVIPALQATLAAAKDRDTITGCLVALAKIGRDLPAMRLRDLFARRLRSHDQEIRETAALCFGIARTQAPDDLDLLTGLFADTEIGRAATGQARVDDRTRSFAGYALGLVLQDSTDNRVRHRIVTQLLDQLKSDGARDRNIAVAAIAAAAQLPAPTTPAAEVLRDAACQSLLDFFALELGPGEQLIQAHCPPAIAQLAASSPTWTAKAKERFCADLQATLDNPGNKRTNHHLAQSCAMALGSLLCPWEDEQSPDAIACKLLLRTWREHKDPQTRSFALVSLGRTGGKAARAALLQEFESANRSIERPWVMLALGNLVAVRHERAVREGTQPEAEPQIAKALISALADVKNPNALGATAIAIGMCQDRSACDALSALLAENQNRDDFAGHVAIALAMLGDERARIQLREMLPRTVRRPQLLMHIATALGRLGEPAVTEDLLSLLRDAEGGLARLSSISMAIGQIGDRRALKPLVEMLDNAQLTPLTRAFAAVALGGVCDPRPLPWNARYTSTLNYRAAVETLTDGAAGILDIL
jgi:HEAT repeat protein